MAERWPACARCEQPSDIQTVETAMPDQQTCTKVHLCFWCLTAHNLEKGIGWDHPGWTATETEIRAECWRLRFDPTSFTYRPELLN